MNPNEDEYTRLNVFQFFLVCARAKAQMACWAGMRMSDKHRLVAEWGKKRDTQKYSENSMKFIDDEINTQESCSSSWREFFEVSLATPLSYHIPRQGSERISRSLLLPSNLLHSSSLALPLLLMRPTVRRDARTDWMRQTKAQRVRGDPRPKAKANQHFFFWLISEALLRQWNWIKLRPTRAHTLSVETTHSRWWRRLLGSVGSRFSVVEKRKMDFFLRS